MFGGTIVMAGEIATGAAIRAAEVLGADLAYLGTRFIATQEAEASPEYKAMILAIRAADLCYSNQIKAVPANRLCPSLVRFDIDVGQSPSPTGPGGPGHLPSGAKPWKTV